MKSFYWSLLAPVLLLTACGSGTSPMNVKGRFQNMSSRHSQAPTGSAEDQLQAQSDKLQDSTFLLAKKLGAAPDTLYKTNFISTGESDEYLSLFMDPAEGKNYILVKEELIKKVFSDLVDANKNLTKSPTDENKKTYARAMADMTTLGDFLHVLVNPQDENYKKEYNTPYNEAMNEIYNLNWVSNCKVWSGDDHSSCTNDDKERQKEIAYHQGNVDSLRGQYQTDLATLTKQINQSDDVQMALAANSGANVSISKNQ